MTKLDELKAYEVKMLNIKTIDSGNFVECNRRGATTIDVVPLQDAIKFAKEQFKLGQNSTEKESGEHDKCYSLPSSCSHAHNLGHSEIEQQIRADERERIFGATRLEVIENGGRKYVKWDCVLEPSIQDEGRTLKIFVKSQLEANKK